MADIDIRQASKERMELRLHVRDTLETLIEWIRATKPSEYMPPSGKDGSVIDAKRLEQKWGDWVDKASELIDGAWKLPALLRDDAIALMEEILAKPKGTPESK